MSLDPKRVLLLHPEDDPACGPWRYECWDRVVDLGTAGEQTRSRWSGMFDCPVESFPKLVMNEFGKIRAALSSGLGYVIDDYGLDWWELIAIRFHEQLALVIRLQKLAEQLDSSDEVWISRPGLHSSILGIILNRAVRCFSQGTPFLKKTSRLIETAGKLTFAQLIEITGDKYDAGYRVRRFATRSGQRPTGPVVLLPVAQGNAARTAVSYAGILPEKNFLVVATRQSGLPAECTSNVSAVKLASYGAKQSQREFREILGRWRKSESMLVHTREASVLIRAGVLSGIAKALRDGLVTVPLLRPALAIRLRQGKIGFPPGIRDAPIAAGAVFDLLERERGVKACVRLARQPTRDTIAALESTFDLPSAEIASMWRSNLERLSTASPKVSILEG